MAILDNILEVQARVLKDKNEGVRLKDLAVKAIYAGMPGQQASQDWINYMNEFSKNSAQLARLTTAEGDQHAYTRQARAYLVGNGTCLPATSTGLPGGIEGFLDVTLEG